MNSDLWVAWDEQLIILSPKWRTCPTVSQFPKAFASFPWKFAKAPDCTHKWYAQICELSLGLVFSWFYCFQVLSDFLPQADAWEQLNFCFDLWFHCSDGSRNRRQCRNSRNSLERNSHKTSWVTMVLFLSLFLLHVPLPRSMIIETFATAQQLVILPWLLKCSNTTSCSSGNERPRVLLSTAM